MYLISQSDEEAQKEARVRRRMEEEVKEQRSLIDALTAECLALREESAALQVSCSPKLLLFYFFFFVLSLHFYGRKLVLRCSRTGDSAGADS